MGSSEKMLGKFPPTFYESTNTLGENQFEGLYSLKLTAKAPENGWERKMKFPFERPYFQELFLFLGRAKSNQHRN